MKLLSYVWSALWTWPNAMTFAAAGVAKSMGLPFWPTWVAIEIAYVTVLVATPAFRRYVDGKRAMQAAADTENHTLMQLKGDGQRAFREFKKHCEAMLAHLAANAPEMVELHREPLATLAGVYLQLQLTRQSLRKTLEAAGEAPADVIAQQIVTLDARLAEPGLPADVRASVESQKEILLQRSAAHTEGAAQLAFLDAEIARLEQQVKLLREQVAVSTAPRQLADRITEVTGTLQGTSRWMAQQRELMAAAHAEEPPRVTLAQPAALRE